MYSRGVGIVNQAAPSGTYQFNILSGLYQDTWGQALTGNFVLNFRGNASTTFTSLIGSSNVVNATFIVQNGTGNSYRMTDITIDSTACDVYYNGSNAPYVPPTGQGYIKYDMQVIGSKAWVIATAMGIGST